MTDSRRRALDTGASLTVISRRLAREVDLPLDPGAACVTLMTFLRHFRVTIDPEGRELTLGPW